MTRQMSAIPPNYSLPSPGRDISTMRTSATAKKNSNHLNTTHHDQDSAKKHHQSTKTDIHPLAPSHAKQPLGRTLIIRTEFIYTEEDTKPARQVKLCGDWNNWKEVSMIREQGRTWSTVTSIPTGYHEFQFVVDDIPVTSTRHPTARSNSVNWRTVLGPANYQFNKNRIRPNNWVRNALQRTGLVVSTSDDENVHDDDDGVDSLVLPNTMGNGQVGKKKIGFGWLAELGIFGFLVVAVSSYLICVSMYSIVMGAN